MIFMCIDTSKNYFLVLKIVIGIFWGWGKMCGVYGYPVLKFEKYICKKFEFI